jgi:two-component system nitrate/nitrite response regulator NarL
MSQIGDATSASAINVYVVAEHRLLREPLVRLLQKRADICVVGANGYTEVIAKEIATSRCDILLLDSPTTVRAKGLVNELSEKFPRIQVVAFGMDEDPSAFTRAVISGVSGYVLKNASAGEVVAAIRGVAQGDAVCPPRLCKALFQLVTRELQTKSEYSSQDESAKFRLTHRQRQLVGLLAGGLSNKEIAANLNLSEFTVKNHIHRIMREVDAENRYEVVDVIRASGLLPTA